MRPRSLGRDGDARACQIPAAYGIERRRRFLEPGDERYAVCGSPYTLHPHDTSDSGGKIRTRRPHPGFARQRGIALRRAEPLDACPPTVDRADTLAKLVRAANDIAHTPGLGCSTQAVHCAVPWRRLHRTSNSSRRERGGELRVHCC